MRDFIHIPYSRFWNIGRLDFLAKLGMTYVVGEQVCFGEVGVAFDHALDRVLFSCDTIGLRDNITTRLWIHTAAEPFEIGQHPPTTWSSAPMFHYITKAAVRERYRAILPDAMIEGIFFGIRSCMLEIHVDDS
jgi:hypothetical protein